MMIHFNTHALAVADLQAHGWRQIKTGAWVSKDRTCRATIHPVSGSDVVVVFYSEIEGAR